MNKFLVFILIILTLINCKGNNKQIVPINQITIRDKIDKIVKNITTNSNTSMPTIVLISDAKNSESIAIYHQLISRIGRNINIIDLNHNITPDNIEQASLTLRKSNAFQDKTLFLSLVSSEFETKPVIIKTKKREFYFIGANDGTFTDIINMYGVSDAYEIEPSKINKNWKDTVLNWRDILYITTSGIGLNIGNKAINEIAKKIPESELVKFNTKNRVIEMKDKKGKKSLKVKILNNKERYGNLVTAVEKSDFDNIGIKPGDIVKIRTARGKLITKAQFEKVIYDVKKHRNVVYFDNKSGLNTLIIANNFGNFEKKYNIKPGEFIVIDR